MVLGALTVVAIAVLAALLAVSSDRWVVFATVLTGLATLVLAAATGILLILNWGVMQATRSAAEATLRAAVATEKSAAATEQEAAASLSELEVLRDQVAHEIRPVLVLESLPNISPFKSNLGADGTLVNLGRGPAINCMVGWLKTGEPGWRWSRPFQVGGESQYVFSVWDLDIRPTMPSIFGSRDGDDLYTVLCEDQAGTRHRFTHPNPVPESSPESDPHQPDWARFHQRISRGEPWP